MVLPILSGFNPIAPPPPHPNVFSPIKVLSSDIVVVNTSPHGPLIIKSLRTPITNDISFNKFVIDNLNHILNYKMIPLLFYIILLLIFSTKVLIK